MTEKKKTTDENVPVFPFHYGQEADSYTFYRVPKILFTAEVFEHLSTDAKLLYGILKDRMQLSVRNGWIDGDGKVFIYYPRQKIMDALTCGNKKAGQLLAELDDRHGIGLITRIHQGLGKPDKIYVHKCIVPDMKVRGSPHPGTENLPDISADTEMTQPVVSEGHIRWCQNDTSGSVETTRQEVSNMPRNNTKEIKTEINETEMSETDLITSFPDEDMADEEADAKDRIEEYYAYRDYFERECSLESLRQEYPYRTDLINEIRDLLTEICCSRKSMIRIGGEDKPTQIVKSRFMKMDSEHIRYVLSCFTENTTKVRNIKQYLLATLYNASMTIGSYYTALVQHDMYGTD
ncbi:MAG TPA: replication initiator A domain-containing protein [Lachnospiraceae bacterium]|nr:replication initiator A domain-containing protein [Lachnospiraceae bacterium]